jgi:hypothetical protein
MPHPRLVSARPEHSHLVRERRDPAPMGLLAGQAMALPATLGASSQNEQPKSRSVSHSRSYRLLGAHVRRF